jgi:uncharacterized protein
MEVKEILKETVRDVAGGMDKTIVKLLLFGSRARGDFDARSDWDLLLILKEETSIEEKVRIYCEVSERLAQKRIASDIIIKSESEMELYKGIGGFTREALREGVVL